MNYFAHGYRYTDYPYFVAGTALPDWMTVVARRTRVRSRHALRLLPHPDQRIVQLAAGLQRHHVDDDRFHRNRAFAELCWQFTRDIRDQLSTDDGLRPSFVGHILVEILLDDALIQQAPAQAARYYESLSRLDGGLVVDAVQRMVRQAVPQLSTFIERFLDERFLYDYAEDAKLLFRLNQVMSRVKLPALPDSLSDWFPHARAAVRARAPELFDSAYG